MSLLGVKAKKQSPKLPVRDCPARTARLTPLSRATREQLSDIVRSEFELIVKLTSVSAFAIKGELEA